jgi:hypothetical protein
MARWRRKWLPPKDELEADSQLARCASLISNHRERSGPETAQNPYGKGSEVNFNGASLTEQCRGRDEGLGLNSFLQKKLMVSEASAPAAAAI